jgi:hypothetical protein
MIPPLQVATSTLLLLCTSRLVAPGTTGLLKEGILENQNETHRRMAVYWVKYEQGTEQTACQARSKRFER